jgi:hypothetical protein
LWKKVAVLLAMAVMVLTMLVVSAPVFAQEFPGEGSGATDPNPGMSEDSRSRYTIPPENKPGSAERDAIANEKNPDTLTGRGKRAEF